MPTRVTSAWPRNEGLAVVRRAGLVRSSNCSFGIRTAELSSARHEPAEPQPDREREGPAEDDVNDRAAERALHRAQTAASASSETARSGWITAMRVRATST